MSDFFIKIWFVNKNGEREDYEDERKEWSLEVAIARSIRELRQSVLKGRRDIKELNISANRIEAIVPDVKKTLNDGAEKTLVEESITRTCADCGKQLESSDALCDECYDKHLIK